MPHEHDPEISQAREAGAYGPVVSDRPVAVQLDELLKNQVDVIQRLRPAVVS